MQTDLDRVLRALVPHAATQTERYMLAFAMALRCCGYAIILLAFIGCFLSLES